jgi:O-antigen/teichoic acid export membrane protein
MDKKVLRWNFVFQYGWVLTNVFNSILLLPIYVRNIDANTLGIWLATGSILGWMTLVDPGVGEVLQQRIAELCGGREYGEIGKMAGSGIIASGIILVLAVVIGLACYFSVGSLINKDIHQYPHLSSALMLSIVATGLSLVSFSLSGINQGVHNAMPVAMASLSANFLFLGVNLVFLFLGYGVLSIAIANLFRNIYINVYNLFSMRKVFRHMGIGVDYDRGHFRKFIRIFSFTSAGKIVSGLAGSIDMLLLARFIPPGMITMYEINKRPINLTNSFIGRHSVALMPVISHARGSGDHSSILRLIERQFRFYCYAGLFTSFIFCLVYKDLISAWGGKDNYAGSTVTYLLVLNSFMFLVSYFLSNVGYALGDIKMNSLFNLVRNLFYGILLFFAAKKYGILGTLMLSIILTSTADLLFFAYRVHKLGYLPAVLVRTTLKLCAIIIPACLLVSWGIRGLIDRLVPGNGYFMRMIGLSGLFGLFYLLLLPLVDGELRGILRGLKGRMVLKLS